MNKKQLKLSLVILGLFAVAVICIGLFSGTRSNVEIEYDVELVKKLESLQGNDLSDIKNFSDGIYEVDTDINSYNLKVLGAEKNNNILILNRMDAGRIEYICKLKEHIKYDAAITYLLQCVHVDSDADIKSIEELIEKIKSGSINYNSIEINEDYLTIKVTNSGDILLDDNVCKKINEKDIVKLSEEEKIKLAEERMQNIEKATKEAIELNTKNLPVVQEDNVSTEEVVDNE